MALLGCTFTTGNHGVSALASGTLRSLLSLPEPVHAHFIDYGCGGSLTEARFGKSRVPIDTINLRFSKRIWVPNHIAHLLLLVGLARIAPTRSARRKLISTNSCLRRILSQQLFLSVAGGDSFSDVYGMKRLLYVALPQLLALLLGRPLVLLPQTYGPFRSATARLIARYILKRAHLIFSRDRDGSAVISELLGGPSDRVRFAYDMGFALEPLPPRATVLERIRAIRKDAPLVGMNVSGLLYTTGLSGGNVFGLADDYPSLVRATLDFLIKEAGCHVLLVPHVSGGAKNAESDEAACANLATQPNDSYGGRLHYLDAGLDHHEAKYLIGQTDLFVGSRMHACIAALSQCVPAVALAYSRKFAGVLQSVGCGSCVVDLRAAGRPETLEAIGKALRERDKLKQDLELRMPTVLNSVLSFFSAEEFKHLLE